MVSDPPAQTKLAHYSTILAQRHCSRWTMRSKSGACILPAVRA